MTSSINPNNIDGTYPIAGQDNDSQGFRTNFTNIKNNFINGKSEIEDLQAKAILKSALTGSSLDNDMAGAVFRGAEVRDLRETRVDLGTNNGTVTLDHSAGSYYTLTTNGNITVAFTSFPSTGKLGRIRLEVTVASNSHVITLPASVTKGVVGLRGYDLATNKVVVQTSGTTMVLEFTTTDGGTTVHVADLSRSRNPGISRAPTATGQLGDGPGMIAYGGAGNGNIYICKGYYDGSTIIWYRAALSTI